VTQTPADWYPDPSDGHRLRYWDGSAWTAHVAPSPVAAQPAGPTTPDGEPLAGWWWRVLAYVIDSFIVGTVASVAALPAQIQIQRELIPVMDRFSRELEQNPETPPDFGAFFDEYVDIFQAHWLWFVVPTVAIALLYWAGFMRWKGGTPGKLALGMRVRLREGPGTLPWSSILARLAIQFGVGWLIYALAFQTSSLTFIAVAASLAMLFLALDSLWATWDPKRQTLHDKLARTNVVKTR
jgi:uncharacterized RDD family membrane protein YckC